MILNIHGFRSNGLSNKSKVVRDEFGLEAISPTFSNIPDLAFDTAEQLIKLFLSEGKKVGLIGSSMGGYMSIYLAQKYDLKAVLINPSIFPYRFDRFTGLVTSSYDNSRFECTKTHLEDLKKYDVKTIKNPQNFLLLLQKGDELLDYKQAEDKFRDSNLIIEEGGSHRFDGFESKIEIIKEFLV